MNPRDDERGLRLAAGGNRFAFTTMIRERAHDLAHGAPPQVFTRGSKPVSVAIVEASHGHIGASRTDTVRTEPQARRIVCVDCGALVAVRRVGSDSRGRPPSRCRQHGLSISWEQLDEK